MGEKCKSPPCLQIVQFLLLTTTGCGKTVISAFDYARFCKENPGKKNRLLFVAHREEILEQSIETFRGVLHDLNFGDL